MDKLKFVILLLNHGFYLKKLRTYTLEELDSSLSIVDLFISRELDFQKKFVCVLKELLVFKAQIVLFLTLQKMGQKSRKMFTCMGFQHRLPIFLSSVHICIVKLVILYLL